jgi:hypothetical protein
LLAVTMTNPSAAACPPDVEIHRGKRPHTVNEDRVG